VHLREADRPALLEHFLALEREDRRLRFGTPLRDEAIAEYVERIDFARDGVFAVHDGTMKLLAVVHVPCSGMRAELGVSVLPSHRDMGLGTALLERAVMYLRNREVREAFVHCLSENGAMMHIARKLGMSVEPCGPETGAHIRLAPSTPQTHYLEWLQDRNSEMLRYFAPFAKSPA
jgi:RimJ/RimL family protein N-acetyltransferase